jgi:DNA-binding beta-propeller fold protein YncE
MTDTSQWSPPSPDPMGVAYLSTSNRLMISDSEIEELNIFAGVNVFESTLRGSLVATHSTLGFSNEPTGVAFNPANGHLFFCDDDADKVFEINPGADSLLFTADDTRTFFSVRPIMSSLDAEGIAFNASKGYLYIADGLNSEVWEIRPGTNGLFDGVPPGGDDQVSHFDTSRFGITDPEAVEFNPDTGTLYISGRAAQHVIETTRTGALLRIVDITFLNAKNPSGLAYAPSSVNASEKNLYIVARGVDNDADPNENDGKMYEITLGQPAATPSPTATKTLTPTPTKTPRTTPAPAPVDRFVYLPAVMLQTNATP